MESFRFEDHDESPAAKIVPLRRPISEPVCRPIVQAEALSYHLIRPREAGPMDVPLLGAAFDVWTDVWNEHLRERDNVDHVYSDDFTRQDEIGALFHGWECVGMTGYRWVDLANPMSRDDSYFRVWPDEAIASACAKGTRVCVGSMLTVPRAWRRATGHSIKELLLALAIERFRRSDAETLVGTMRNDRSMDKLGYRLGFKPVARGLPFHGGTVDLVVFHREGGTRPPLEAASEAVLRRLAPASRR
jgi:hypothetical protein